MCFSYTPRVMIRTWASGDPSVDRVLFSLGGCVRAMIRRLLEQLGTLDQHWQDESLPPPTSGEHIPCLCSCSASAPPMSEGIAGQRRDRRTVFFFTAQLCFVLRSPNMHGLVSDHCRRDRLQCNCDDE